MGECLSFLQLVEYRAGRCPAVRDREEHLRACPACRERLRLVEQGDELESQIRREGRAAPRTASSMLPGRIGGYRPVAEIGRGGMGVVYEAVQEKLQRPVALKVLPGLLPSLQPDSAARFRTEAAAAARLHHPNIVPIFDYGEEAGCQYYVMELVKGWPLSVIIEKAASAAWASAATGTEQGPAEPALLAAPSYGQYCRQVAGLFAEVAGALQFAHDCGVVHRDIKPSNLILARSGRLMIADFGLAKLDRGSLTSPGQLLGTLRYMSPEQIGVGGRPVDHRTDVYALGATLYEMLAFQPAVAGADDHALLRAVAEHEPAPLRRLQPQAPRELEVICAKALAKNPADRYASAAALQADLQRFLEDRPLLARPPEWPARTWKYIRRNPLLVAVIAVGVFATTSVLSTVLYYESRRERGELRVRYAADLVTLGREHLDGGSPHMAIEVLSRALAYDRSLSYVYTLRAAAYARLRRYDQAIDDWTQAIQATAGRPSAYLRRGMLRLLAGNPGSAALDFHRTLELAPRHLEARVFALLAGAAAAEPGSTPGAGPGDGRLTSSVALSIDDASSPAAPGAVRILEALQAFLAGATDGGQVLSAAEDAPAAEQALYCAALAEEHRRRGQWPQAEALFTRAAQQAASDDLRFFIEARVASLPR